MRLVAAVLLIVSVFIAPMSALADELTQSIQKDLLRLGYEPGNIQGDLDKATIVAISKFQAKNDLDITGEPSARLADEIEAILKGNNRTAQDTAKDTPKTRSPEELQAAQQACLQEKAAARQEAAKKKRGFGSLMRAAARTAGMAGNNELYEVSRDVYNVNATATDISSAARDLGLTEDEVEACRNP